MSKLLHIAFKNIKHHWTGQHCLGKVGAISSFAVAVSGRRAAVAVRQLPPVSTAHGSYDVIDLETAVAGHGKTYKWEPAFRVAFQGKLA